MSSLILRFMMVCALSAGAVHAADPYIAVVEKVAGAVAFFSEDGKQLAQVKTGSFPHEAALSPDGKLLYVSNNGVLWMTEDSMGTNTISVLDVKEMKKLYDIDLGKFHRPHGIALVPGSNRVVATTERPYGLIAVDPVKRAVVRDYDVKGKSPHMVMPARDGQIAFVSNADSDSVAAVNLATGATKVIPTAAHPQGGVLSLAGDKLYMTCTNANQIAIIDTKTLAVTGSIPTGKGPARVAITPDGKTLIYNLQYEPGVGFADIASGKQIASVALTGRPLSLTLTKDGKRAFAGIQDQDKVVFISVAGKKIERVVEVPKGSGPDPAIPLGTR